MSSQKALQRYDTATLQPLGPTPHRQRPALPSYASFIRGRKISPVREEVIEYVIDYNSSQGRTNLERATAADGVESVGAKENKAKAKISQQIELLQHKHYHDHDHIGLQRLTFLLARFPAIAIGVLSSWLLFGRGGGFISSSSQQELNSPPAAGANYLSAEERNAALAGLVTAALILLTTAIYGSHNHNHSYPSSSPSSIGSRGQVSWRLVFGAIGGAFAIATVALAAVALLGPVTHPGGGGGGGGVDGDWGKILWGDELPPTTRSGCLDPLECLSRGERLVYACAMLGISAVVGVLLAVSTLSGIYAMKEVNQLG